MSGFTGFNDNHLFTQPFKQMYQFCHSQLVPICFFFLPKASQLEFAQAPAQSTGVKLGEWTGFAFTRFLRD